jgi:hypothetical protein
MENCGFENILATLHGPDVPKMHMRGSKKTTLRSLDIGQDMEHVKKIVPHSEAPYHSMVEVHWKGNTWHHFIKKLVIYFDCACTIPIILIITVNGKRATIPGAYLYH